MVLSNKWIDLEKIIRYGLVGTTNTAFSFSIMYTLALLHFHYLTYTAVACISAMFLSFILNLLFTFRVNGIFLQRMLRFFAINLTNLGIVEIIEFILIEHFHLPHLEGVLLAMIWYVVFGFLMNRRYVYHTKSNEIICAK